MLFQPLPLLLNAQQFGLTQGQLQALTLQFKFGGAFLIEHLPGVLPRDIAIALAQIGVMRNIVATAPVTGQTLGTGQRLTGPDHVLGCDTQHIGVFFNRLKFAGRLLQCLLAGVMPRAAGKPCTGDQ